MILVLSEKQCGIIASAPVRAFVSNDWILHLDNRQLQLFQPRGSVDAADTLHFDDIWL